MRKGHYLLNRTKDAMKTTTMPKRLSNILTIKVPQKGIAGHRSTVSIGDRRLKRQKTRQRQNQLAFA